MSGTVFVMMVSISGANANQCDVFEGIGRQVNWFHADNFFERLWILSCDLLTKFVVKVLSMCEARLHIFSAKAVRHFALHFHSVGVWAEEIGTGPSLQTLNWWSERMAGKLVRR